MADPGVHSPLLDFFRRGEVARDVRDLAARGALAPAPLEQLALLILLVDDPDDGIAACARDTLDRLPHDALGAFLAREGTPPQMREFFAARGAVPVPGPDVGDDVPLLSGDEVAPADAAEEAGEKKALGTLSVTDRIKLAMRGTREQRAALIRDPNRLVAAAVLSSPKLTEAEVEAFARMANVTDEVLRIIGTNRNWTKNYTVIAALVRNPKTPPALSMRFVPRLSQRDVKGLATDRNVPEVVRLAARKILTKSKT